MLTYGLLREMAMRIREVIIRLVIMLLGVWLVACSNPGTVGMAEHQAEQFFQAVKGKEFDKAATYFQDTPNDPRGRWAAQLRENYSNLGDLESYRLVDKEVDTVYSGTRYILVYVAKYTKKPMRETLILFDGVSTFSGKTGKGIQLQGMVVKPITQ